MKKIVSVGVFIALAAAVFAGGVSDKKATGKKTSSFTVGVVTDTGGIDDRSFNQGTWEGAKRYAEEVGGDAKYLQSSADADYIPNLSTFADEGKTLIVAPGFLFDEAMATVSAEYPKQNFMVIDTVVADHPNVCSVTFAQNEGSFLAGVAAALKSKELGSKEIGIVLGMDFPTMQEFEAGFEAGIKAVDPALVLKTEIPNSFMDPAKGQALASKLYDDGCAVIFACAGNTGNGVIKEARDRCTNGQNVWVIGVDRDQYADGVYDGTHSVILTSMMKRVDTAAYMVSKLADEGKFPGGQHLVLNLKQNGVGLPEKNPNLSEDIIAKVNGFKQKIISGEVSVPTVPSRVKK